METPSELELFLGSQRSEGFVQQVDGTFTVAQEMALQKFANFQLPFEHAWLVKVVQCAVSEGLEDPIRIDLNPSEVRCYLVCPSLTLEAVEYAFYDIEPSRVPAIRHLVSALRVTGLRFRWSFQLVFPKLRTSLIWDGEKLHRSATDQNYDRMYLAVRHTPPSQGVRSWIADQLEATSLNAGFVKALREYCFACPVPLSVDGRRLDSLFHCPSHGFRRAGRFSTIPLALRQVEAIESCLPLPKETYRKSSLTSAKVVVNKAEFGRLWQVRAALSALEQGAKEVREPPSTFPLLLSMRMRDRGDEKANRWVPTNMSSVVYWIQDGAVVQSQPLRADQSQVGVAVFVDAGDLDNDLSGLELLEGQRYLQRHQTVLKTVEDFLVPSNFQSLAETVQRNFDRERARSMSLGTLVGGVGIIGLSVAPVLAGLLALGGGFVVWRAYGLVCEENRELLDSLDEVRSVFRIARERFAGP